MDTLRRRIPFKLADDNDDNNDNLILDEEQQDAVIESLRKENDIVNRWYSSALMLVVGLSCILHLLTFQRNPLLAIFPINSTQPSLPLPAAFTILSLFVHANLALFLDVKVRLSIRETLTPLSYRFLYLLCAVAPTLSLFLNKPWQTTVWWCSTPLVVAMVQTVLDSVQQNIQGIADLETMKYSAPGA
ncbi:hypothetical protein D9619_007175 [Psilocybe cf. subviscida]|uniref:Uncharacterized protein n=1 Tax=Psilocybe cf. subviscida TaxID=2480587 RepID=A0A8H5B2R3_9AGAR|nr:hypothetical protein D9619_007175 [Psilocybe cf. subviscida]